MTLRRTFIILKHSTSIINTFTATLIKKAHTHTHTHTRICLYFQNVLTIVELLETIMLLFLIFLFKSLLKKNVLKHDFLKITQEKPESKLFV